MYSYTRNELVAKSQEVVQRHECNLLKTKHNNLEKKIDFSCDIPV